MFQWISKLIGKRSLENPAVPLFSPTAVNYLGAARASSGVSVDRTTVLAYPAVWRALTLVSNKIGRLPLSVYKRNKQGGREQDYEHPAYWLLSRRPSDLYTPFVFKSTLVAHALLHGNGYGWILRDNNGKANELIILDPLTTGVAMRGNQLTYYVRMGTETRTILPENMLHLKGMGHDGLVGYSVLDCLRESFGLGLAAQRYGSVFFRNNGAPGPLVITFPSGVRLDKEQLAQLREQLEKVHVGLDNSHRPMVLGNGGTVGAPWTIDNEHAQFLQTREHEVACGICNIFGVSPRKLGVDVNSSYGALAVDEQAFLHDTIDPWLTAFEEELEAKLLKESQMIRDSHFIEFDRRQLEQADYEKKSTTLLAQLNGGGITYNQWAEAMNLPGIGDDGDRLRVPTTVTYLDLLGEDPEIPDTDDPAEDLPLSSDPNQPAEEPAAPVGGKSPVNGDPVDGTPTRALLVSIIGRYLTRVHRSAQAACKRPDWPDWLSDGLDAHRRILCESLAPVRADADVVADQLLDGLRAELREVTRDQVDAVFERLDPERWADEVLHG